MKWLNKLLGKKSPENNSTPPSDHVILPKTWHMPVAGQVISLDALPDPAFAQGMMGAGFAIRADAAVVSSPVDGTVSAIFPGGHAIGLTTDDGVELLIHIGIDSVNLKGEGFTPHVSDGATVKKGDPLVEVDFALLEQRLPESAVIIVFPNINHGHIVIQDQMPVWQAGDK